MERPQERPEGVAKRGAIAPRSVTGFSLPRPCAQSTGCPRPSGGGGIRP